MGFILRVLVVALGLWLASALVPGIQVEDGWTLVGAALLLRVAAVAPVSGQRELVLSGAPNLRGCWV